MPGLALATPQPARYERHHRRDQGWSIIEREQQIFSRPVQLREQFEMGNAAMRDFSALYVRFGSKAEKLDLSIRCPLCPRKRTNSRHLGMSALCH
jgi:hypothetical protein